MWQVKEPNTSLTKADFAAANYGVPITEAQYPSFYVPFNEHLHYIFTYPRVPFNE